MPPVSAAAVSGGHAAFRRLAARGDPVRPRIFSERCHAAAADTASWDALDYCAAFDQAAFLADGKKPTAANGDYFIDRHDSAVHLYLSRVSSMDAVASRLERIRKQVATSRNERIAKTERQLNRVAKHGWRFSAFVGQGLTSDRLTVEKTGKPRDF
jgi:hypothetical protein